MTIAVSNPDLARSLPASPFYQGPRNVNSVLTINCGARLLHFADCFRIVDANPQIIQNVQGRCVDFLTVTMC